MLGRRVAIRTGAEYRDSLRDGRKIWVIGEGRLEDLTTHPATCAMVDYYADWYDRHFDPKWQDLLLMPPDASGNRLPLLFQVPKSSDDLRRMGRAFAATIFPTAGNVTHTPAYGNLIALGILDAVQRRNPTSDNVITAAKYRDGLAQTGRFLTFSAGGPTIGYRFRHDPQERASLRLIKETDAGIVVRGKIGMHTSVPFVDEVYIGHFGAVTCGQQRVTFVVPVATPGVTVVCRKIAARHRNRFIAPLSSRFDELDAQLWLDDVFVPWEHVFLTESPPGGTDLLTLEPERGEGIADWLFWHQLYCWLAKAEFTLGLALACTDAMGLREHQLTLDYLVDLVIDVQTVRSCLTAAELNPQVTAAGYALPGLVHIAAGSIAMLKARQRMAEILRSLPGSSLVMAPADTDLTAPEMAAGLEESFGGGGYTALQRAALLNLAWDHIASGLDGRESAFELHANGGIPVWRNRLRAWFPSYDDLANGVLTALDLDMPTLNFDSLRRVAQGPRRPVSAPSQTGSATGS
ncbi:MAG TPA: 4-hydroxyphenylacetate 3-hydroxylase N-terminal domain-containing protein [Alphaproteobacteria bacterium]|nr:4-hydroxyphenylacetate 3-hydroxylase N-terminal domain-containing protein [Alphaproteobacteria bacterium]